MGLPPRAPKMMLDLITDTGENVRLSVGLTEPAAGFVQG